MGHQKQKNTDKTSDMVHQPSGRYDSMQNVGQKRKTPGNDPGRFLRCYFQFCLEQATDFSGCRVYINTTEGRVGAGARHQADGAGAGAEEFGARVNQHVANGQSPILGNALFHRVVGQAQVGLDHHGGKVGVFGIVFQHFSLGGSFRCPIHTIGTVDFPGDNIPRGRAASISRG